MRLSRTPGWWATRLEFAIAIAALAVPALVFMSVLSQFHHEPIGYVSAMTVAGSTGVVIGLAWMIRIYRAPLRMDAKAYWRYRDGA